MITFDYYGEPVTEVKIVPGDTATTINAYAIQPPGNFMVRFTGAGTSETLIGSLITGATNTTATAIVKGYIIETGSYGAGTAAGILFYDQVSGVAFSATENWKLPGGTDDGTFASNHVDISLYKNRMAKAALVTCKSYTAHMSWTSVTPTAAAGTNVGHPITANGSVMFRDINLIKKVKFIDAVSGSASVLNVTLFF